MAYLFIDVKQRDLNPCGLKIADRIEETIKTNTFYSQNETAMFHLNAKSEIKDSGG